MWGTSPSENQVLDANLHPMQSSINKSKLHDALESIAVQCVNSIGVDLNYILCHKHLQSVLKFLSGLGPMSAKKLIKSINHSVKKINSRDEMLRGRYLHKICY